MGGEAPEDLQNLGHEIWTPDKPDPENGVNILGTPLGTDAYVQAETAKRMHKEQTYLHEITQMDDPQQAWVLLSMSAVPRANHMVRILPPTDSRPYAEAHDDGIWQTFCTIVGCTNLADDTTARCVATPPGRLGGLGLRSSTRTAPGAYWASRLSALAVLNDKLPNVANTIVHELQLPDGPTTHCLQ